MRFLFCQTFFLKLRSSLRITATDLDLIFINEINNVEIVEEEAPLLPLPQCMISLENLVQEKFNFNLASENKIQVESEKSIFNLNCLPASEFPVTDENFTGNEFIIKSRQLLKLLNKCKFSISNDETRHYLSGIYFHQTNLDEKFFLTAAATDSHRMSISKINLGDKINFEPIILPKKTIFQLVNLLADYEGEVKISNIKSKIKFEFEKKIFISKLIYGKFPNYLQVIPKDNKKRLEVDLKLFMSSVDRVASVSLDKKDGVKFNLKKIN